MTDHPTLVPDQEPDRNDGKEWSAADLEDLALASEGRRLGRGCRIFSLPRRHHRGSAAKGERAWPDLRLMFTERLADKLTSSPNPNNNVDATHWCRNSLA